MDKIDTKKIGKHIPKTYIDNLEKVKGLNEYLARNTINNNFSDKLKFYMKINNISGKSFAEKIGVSPSAINKWTNGSRFPNSEYKISQIADILNISVVDLLSNTLSQRDMIIKQELKTNFEKYFLNNELKSKASNNLTSKEKTLIDSYRKCTEVDKTKILIDALSLAGS